MSAVTINEAWPDFGGAFTVAELDRMPDDGHRYELLDGVLVVRPRPTTVHQSTGSRGSGQLRVGRRVVSPPAPPPLPPLPPLPHVMLPVPSSFGSSLAFASASMGCHSICLPMAMNARRLVRA